MKNLIITLSLFFVFSSGITAQKELSLEDGYINKNKIGWNKKLIAFCKECNDVYKPYLNFACYNRKPIFLGMMSGTQIFNLKEEDAKEINNDPNKRTSIEALEFFQHGYHFAKMNPFDLQQSERKSRSNYNIFHTIKDNKNNIYENNSTKEILPKRVYYSLAKSERISGSELMTNNASSLSEVSGSDIGFNAGIKLFSFSGNTSFQEEYQRQESQATARVESMRTKSLARLTLTDFTILSKGFLDALYKLPATVDTTNIDSKDYKAYITFYDTWGTHYAKDIYLGAKKGAIQKITVEDLRTIKSKESGFSISASLSTGSTTRKDRAEYKDKSSTETTRELPGYSLGGSFSKHVGNSSEAGSVVESRKTQSIEVGSLTDKGYTYRNASPIGFELIPIYELCDGTFNDQKINKIKDNLEKVLRRYNNQLGKKLGRKWTDAFLEESDFNPVKKILVEDTNYRLHPKSNPDLQIDWHGNERKLKTWNKKTGTNQFFSFHKVPDYYTQDDPSAKNIYQIKHDGKCVTHVPDGHIGDMGEKVISDVGFSKSAYDDVVEGKWWNNTLHFYISAPGSGGCDLTHKNPLHRAGDGTDLYKKGKSTSYNYCAFAVWAGITTSKDRKNEPFWSNVNLLNNNRYYIGECVSSWKEQQFYIEADPNVPNNKEYIKIKSRKNGKYMEVGKAGDTHDSYMHGVDKNSDSKQSYKLTK